MLLVVLHVQVSMLLAMLHVYGSYPCCVSILCPCSCCMSMLLIHAAYACCSSIPHVHVSMLHVLSACSWCISMLRVHDSMLHVDHASSFACPCCMSISHEHALWTYVNILMNTNIKMNLKKKKERVHAAFPCRMTILHVYSSCQCCMLVLHVYAPCPCLHAACPSCLLMLHFHAARPCCVFFLHVHPACPCCMPVLHIDVSMLHVHAAWTYCANRNMQFSFFYSRMSFKNWFFSFFIDIFLYICLFAKLLFIRRNFVNFREIWGLESKLWLYSAKLSYFAKLGITISWQP